MSSQKTVFGTKEWSTHRKLASDLRAEMEYRNHPLKGQEDEKWNLHRRNQPKMLSTGSDTNSFSETIATPYASAPMEEVTSVK